MFVVLVWYHIIVLNSCCCCRKHILIILYQINYFIIFDLCILRAIIVCSIVGDAAAVAAACSAGIGLVYFTELPRCLATWKWLTSSSSSSRVSALSFQGTSPRPRFRTAEEPRPCNKFAIQQITLNQLHPEFIWSILQQQTVVQYNSSSSTKCILQI